MPDLEAILQAAGLAALVAALLTLVTRPWRQTDTSWVSVGAAIGVGAGWFAGAYWLGFSPRWPPREDQERLLLVLLPAVVFVESASAFLIRSGWGSWLLRLVLSLAAARVLLHGSVYLSDFAGPGTAEWQGPRFWLILGGLGTALAANWAMYFWLARDEAASAVLPPLTLAVGGAGATIMLSGYASGGQIGLMLAPALAPAALLAFIRPRSSALQSALGVGVVGFFGLLIIGRFFASLTTTNAAILFAIPLLGWLMKLPGIRRLGLRARCVATTALAALVVVAIVSIAVKKFNDDSRPPTVSGSENEPTIDDYMNFGK